MSESSNKKDEDDEDLAEMRIKIGDFRVEAEGKTEAVEKLFRKIVIAIVSSGVLAWIYSLLQ